MRTIISSAPAKLILLGGKGVNWGFPALVAAVGLRTTCTLILEGKGEEYSLSFEDKNDRGGRSSLKEFKAEVDKLRKEKAYDDISDLARSDFFAPTRYVLSHIVEKTGVLGFSVKWVSEVPSGSGLGSGAAASASLAAAVFRAGDYEPEPRELAWTAWQGDVIAHGGVGTGLDSGASALGGIVRYSLEDGPKSVPNPPELPLVIGDTLIRASTATSNTASRNWLAEHPMRFHLLEEMGMLVDMAQDAMVKGDFSRLGHLMNLNHLIKEKLGMSIPKTEALINASLGAGAIGAKISGKGSGGIIVILSGPGKEQDIARAIKDAGGEAIIPKIGVAGAQIESDR